MAFIKADFPVEVKKEFQKFCKTRDLKEAEVVRRAVKNYMSQHTPASVSLNIQRMPQPIKNYGGRS